MISKKILLLSLFALLLSSCTQLVTKQFVVALDKSGEEPGPRVVNGWTFHNPDLISYKDMPTTAHIKKPNTYWLTIQAEYENKHKAEVAGDFLVDSVFVYAFNEDETYIRHPSRSAEFDSNTGKFHIRIFNFFDDQGIVFKQSPDSVRLNFTADFYDLNQKIDFEYILHRDIQDRSVPFLPR